MAVATSLAAPSRWIGPGTASTGAPHASATATRTTTTTRRTPIESENTKRPDGARASGKSGEKNRRGLGAIGTETLPPPHMNAIDTAHDAVATRPRNGTTTTESESGIGIEREAGGTRMASVQIRAMYAGLITHGGRAATPI